MKLEKPFPDKNWGVVGYPLDKEDIQKALALPLNGFLQCDTRDFTFIEFWSSQDQILNVILEIGIIDL